MKISGYSCNPLLLIAGCVALSCFFASCLSKAPARHTEFLSTKTESIFIDSAVTRKIRPNKEMMEWFYTTYLPSLASASDLRINLMRANLKDLLRTAIISDEMGPLPIDRKLVSSGVTLEFFGTTDFAPEAKQTLASDQLKNGFGK